MVIARRADPRVDEDERALPELGGQLLEIVGAVADPTTWKPAPVATDGEPRFQAFLDALGVAVYTTDADGLITFYNEAAAGFWGRRPELGEEWCGSWRLFWSDGTPIRHDECPMAIALKEGRAVRGFQAIAERPDGTRVSFVPYPTPLRNADGQIVGAVNVLVDITEQVMLEDALRASADALRESNAVKDEFLGLVSHELRTPVTTIFGYARLLKDRSDRLTDDEKKAMMADIADDSERLLGIIENLLLLTRLERSTKLDLEPQVLVHVVGKSIEAFRRGHVGRHVRLSCDPRHVIVEADRTYLELLMENLLSNADKYSPAGAEVEVVVRAVDGEAQVVVLDRGIGLPKVDADRIFTPFYRTDAAKAWANGIGIGLAVCKRVVEIQGGRIWAAPRRRGGAEMGFALPLAQDPGDYDYPPGAEA
jgi:PAS domain S-box-containing protein